MTASGFAEAILEAIVPKFVAVAPTASDDSIVKPYCLASFGQTSVASELLVGMSLL